MWFGLSDIQHPMFRPVDRPHPKNTAGAKLVAIIYAGLEIKTGTSGTIDAPPLTAGKPLNDLARAQTDDLLQSQVVEAARFHAFDVAPVNVVILSRMAVSTGTLEDPSAFTPLTNSGVMS